MEILSTFLLPSAWIALITLILLETVLGIDNIIFLSIVTSRLPEKQQPKARFIGLSLAMFARIAMLLGISAIMTLTKPIFTVNTEWIDISLTGQSIILFLGGAFLLYKSVSEIHHKLEGADPSTQVKSVKESFAKIIFQIILLDMVFSLDSILTAIGMVSFTTFGHSGALAIIIVAIVVAIAIMLCFAGPVSRFVNDHPSIQMLALSFLILISVTLFVEASHMSHLTVFGTTVNSLPKGYIYFAIAFSLLVEMLNMKYRKKNKVQNI